MHCSHVERKDEVLSITTTIWEPILLESSGVKIGHCYCIIPTSNTSHIQPLFFIKTLTQWAKHTDRIKIRYGQKRWKQKADIKENLLHVVFVLIDISLLKFSLLFKYFDTQLVFELWLDQKCHNELQRGGEGVSSSLWLVKRFRVKHDIVDVT